MNTSNMNTPNTPADGNAVLAPTQPAFEDPVAYLASFGIEAIVVSETTMLPAAA